MAMAMAIAIAIKITTTATTIATVTALFGEFGKPMINFCKLLFATKTKWIMEELKSKI